MSEPTTEVGRALLEHVHVVAWFDAETSYGDHIAAIEDEAAAVERERIRAALVGLEGTRLRRRTYVDEEGIRRTDYQSEPVKTGTGAISLSAALAIIDGAES